MFKKTLALTLFLILFIASTVFGGALFNYPKFKAFDSNGDPLSGGKLYTYAPGTTTNKTTYSDRDLSTANANPLILDSYGEGVVYGAGVYKFVLKDADDGLIWTFDNFDGLGGYLGANFYFPDASQADQGVAVGSVTVKDFVDSIGGTAKATIALTRGSTGNYTDYIFLTSETISSNLTLSVEPGARVSVAVSKTLTINGPGNYPDMQWITGSGLVSFGPNAIKEVLPEWWGTGDDILCKAVTSVQGTVSYVQSVSEGTIIQLSEGDYTLSTECEIGSGCHIKGVGVQSRIKEGSSFTGTIMLELAELDANNYCSGVTLENFCIEASTNGVYGIKSETGTNFTHSTIRNLWFDTVSFPLSLAVYTQDVLIDGIRHINGAVDQILHLKGNANNIKNITKEGVTGATVDPYIHIENHTTGNSSGNHLEDIIIEGTTSVNKSGIKFTQCSDTTLHNYWYEPTLTDGYSIRIDTCDHIFVTGNSKYITSSHKLKIDASRAVYFDRLDVQHYDENFDDCIEIDATSTLVIDILETRKGGNAFLINKATTPTLDRRLIVNRHYNKQIHADATAGISPWTTPRILSPQNLLVNGSFEEGVHGWTWSGVPDTNNRALASTIAPGLMLDAQDSGTGSFALYQAIDIPAGWCTTDRPIPLTFSALVKLGGTTNWVAPYINGAGITVTTGAYSRVYAGDGWGLISITFYPQAADATTYVGIFFQTHTAAADMQVDEACLNWGTESILGGNKFNSIQLGSGTNHGGNTITYGAAAPAAGTWRQGDIVFNTGAPSGGKVGWVCTTAGTPGTWKTFGVIS